MHKEIEEAREWLYGDDTETIYKNCADRWAQAQPSIVKNLLALFDRMQQEPVVEIGLVEGDLHNTEPVVFNYGKIADFKDGRYRRELEDAK